MATTDTTPETDESKKNEKVASDDRWVNDAIRSRWIDIVIYAITGAFAFEILLPLGMRLFKKAPPAVEYQPWFLFGVGVLAVIVLAFIVAEPIRIRRDHWRHVHRYPPLWFAPALAFVAVLAFAALPSRFQALRTAPDWEHAWLVVTVVVAFGVAVALRQIPWHKRETHRLVVDPSVDVLQWGTLRDWFATEGPTERDLFRHASISTRIANTLLDQSCEQAIALLGPFGSGKSSILARVRAKLQDSDTPMFIVAEFNGWAIPEAADAPRVALERMIDALGRFVDMQRFRGLPDAYKRLVAAEPSGLVAKILGTSADNVPLAARGESRDGLLPARAEGSTPSIVRTTLRAWQWANASGIGNRRCGWRRRSCRPRRVIRSTRD